MTQEPYQHAQTETPSKEGAQAERSADKSTAQKAGEKANEKARETAAFWNDRQHRDLLFYLSVAIFFLELVVGVVAFLYGVMHAEPGVNGGPPRFQFPWLVYALAAILTPAGLLLIVHLAGVGLFRSLRGQDQDEAWRQDLPQRLRKVYAIIQGAPTVVLLIGILMLGAALFYIDGAMTAMLRLGATLEPYLPWIIGGVGGAWCVGYLARTWFTYRTRRMEAEFEFRREVLERTGIIIVDRGSVQLPPGGADLNPSRALEGGQPIAVNGGPSIDDPGQPQGPVLDVVAEEKK